MKSDPKVTEPLLEEIISDLPLENELNSEELSNHTVPPKTKEKSKVTMSEEVKKLVALLAATSDIDEKLKLCIDFMREKLSGSTTPSFREFWEARRVCLPLFKENISAKIRADLWQQYVDLSVEARRLKGILDEQSAFACEQIGLAIESLIRDLDNYESLLSQMQDLKIQIELPPLSLKKEEYNSLQKQLHLLNAFAAKVNSLRKEAIKTDMRIRSKNKIFENLSMCGDRIFPQRKDLIKKLSSEFKKDIESFLEMHFKEGVKSSAPLHVLREEVKGLQALAKQLTLNTQSFKDTRVSLSFCWDQLKALDKEKKKEMSEQRAVQKESYEKAMLKVKEFEEFCKEQASLSTVLAKHDEILLSLREIKDLRGYELKQIKDQLSSSKRPIEEKQREARLELEAQAKEQEAARKKKVEDLREELQAVLSATDQDSLENLQLSKATLEEKVKVLVASKAEKMNLERLLRQLKDRLLEAKGKRLLSLSCSDQEEYNELQSILVEKRDRRIEVKSQLEDYRKALGGSGFDFEKAMLYRDLIESEKDVLEKMDMAIDELEEKISQIEG
jgi:hypothetical protein